MVERLIGAVGQKDLVPAVQPRHRRRLAVHIGRSGVHAVQRHHLRLAGDPRLPPLLPEAVLRKAGDLVRTPVVPSNAGRHFRQHAGLPQCSGSVGRYKKVGVPASVGAHRLTGQGAALIEGVGLAAPALRRTGQQSQKQGQHQRRRGDHHRAPSAAAGGQQGETQRTLTCHGSALLWHPHRHPAPLGGVLPAGLMQEGKAQYQCQHQHSTSGGQCRPYRRGQRFRLLQRHAHRRLTVPLVHSIQAPGSVQRQTQHPAQGQTADGRAQHRRRTGHHSRAGQQPQPDAAGRRAQRHQHGHGFLLPSHEQIGKQHQHRQRAAGGGQRHRRRGGLHGLQGLCGGGIALIVQGDPHAVRRHSL